MCKVMMIAGITDKTRDNAIKFIKAMAKPMSMGNTDGLGYAAVTKKGELFAERWLNNSDAFVDNSDADLYKDYGDVTFMVPATVESTSYGTSKLDKIVALTLHTRFATTAKGMSNTHPFIKNNISVIHNGVIDNYKDFNLEQSTCDSESILIQYDKDQVHKDIDSIASLTSKLKGYYACGVLAPSDKGYILDIFKGNHANLSFCYVVELETMVFATSIADVINVCKDLGFKTKSTMVFKDGCLLRLDAVTGKPVGAKSFTPAARYAYSYPSYNDYWPKDEVVKKKETTVTPALVSYFKAGRGTIEEVV